MKTEYSRSIIKLLIESLNSRKGFDDWWGTVDDDIQEEITEELASILKDELDYL